MERYYKIGEFSRITGISTNTLREYEKKGILVPHHRSPSGYRYYSQKQYENIVKGGMPKNEGG